MLVIPDRKFTKRDRFHMSDDGESWQTKLGLEFSSIHSCSLLGKEGQRCDYESRLPRAWCGNALCVLPKEARTIIGVLLQCLLSGAPECDKAAKPCRAITTELNFYNKVKGTDKPRRNRNFVAGWRPSSGMNCAS